MIRALQPGDWDRIRQLQGEHVWEMSPDFEGGCVLVDSQDVPVLIVGAWKKAECHMLIDPSWGTPGSRMEALQQCAKAMERKLYGMGYREGLTYFARAEGFCRRLREMGWMKSAMMSWHKVVTHG